MVRRLPFALLLLLTIVLTWFRARRRGETRPHFDAYYVGVVCIVLTGFAGQVLLPDSASSKLFGGLLFGFLAIDYVDKSLTQSRAIRSARWKLVGRCEKCSYDLRASSDRCPECGTVVPQKAPANAPAP